MQGRQVSPAAAAALALLLLAAACSDDNGTDPDGGTGGDGQPGDAGQLPPKICRKPGALGGGPYFRDVTKDWKLDATNLAVTGVRLASADLDEDGYPDVVTHMTGANNRDDLKASPPKRYRRLLLNVASGTRRAFSDHTDASKLFQLRSGGLGRSSHFAIFADVNNDGHLDAFCGTNVDASTSASPDPGDRSEVLLGDGKGGFTLAKQSDVSHKEKYSTYAASFLDYDRDGNIDLFVGFSYEIYGYIYASNQDRLYRGNGDGTFTEVTDKLGLTTFRDKGFEEGTASRPTWGVTACDIDGDGDQDIMGSVYGRQWNWLWRNDGTKFVNVAKAAGFDGDALTDYTDNEFYKCYCQITGKCTATPKITCSSNYWGAGIDDKPWRLNGNTFSTVCADVDNDGDMDLYNAEIVHWHIGKSSDPSELLLNDGTTPLKFTRPGNDKTGLKRVDTTSSWNHGDITAAIFDFDADGLQDIILMDSDYPETYTRLFRQTSKGKYSEIAKQAGIQHHRGQQVTVADFDLDGDLDVVVGTSTMRAGTTGPKVAQVHFYENLVGNKANWIKVRLTGSGKGGANRAAIGAWVKVTTKGGGTQLREVGGGYGHFGLQHDLVLHFGLGSACEVDKLEVRWPDGKNSTHTFTGVRANYLVTIDQKTGKLSYVTD